MLILISLRVNDGINTKVFQVDNGFGYSMVYKKKILIKQEFSPGIQNRKAFCSKEDALHIAELVKDKLERNLSPSISIQELKEYNIQINCN